MTDSSDLTVKKKTLRDALIESGGPGWPRRLPVYQRRYSWEEKHIDQFIDDAQASSRHAADGDEVFNFAGAMVLATEGDGAHSIIDGQQRLTTLMLLLLVGGVRLLNSTKPETQAEGKEFIKLARTSDGHLIIQPNKSDLGMTKSVVLTFNEMLPDSLSALNLKEFPGDYPKQGRGVYFRAFAHVRKRLSTMAPALVSQVLNTLLDRFFVARIMVTDPVRGAEVFRSLNDTGKDLDAADLVRILVFTLFDQSSEGAEEANLFMDEDWFSFEEELGSDPSRLGDFYYYYAAAALDTSVTSGTLLATLKKHWASREPAQILADLRGWLLAYRLLLPPDAIGSAPVPNSYAATFREALRRLKRTPSATAYRVYALRAVKEALANSRLRASAAKCLRTLESFVVRKGLYESQVTGIQITLREMWDVVGLDNKKARKFLKTRFKSKDLRGPTDEELRARLVTLDHPSYNRVTTYVLQVRERAKREPSLTSALRKEAEGEKKHGVASFQAVEEHIDVDHIFPQTPSRQWKLESRKVQGEKVRLLEGLDFAEIKNNLGNLTLLEHPLNRARNSSTAASLIKYYKRSTFVDTLSIRTTVQTNDDFGRHLWSTADMETRANAIVDWILEDDEGWPQPWD